MTGRSGDIISSHELHGANRLRNTSSPSEQKLNVVINGNWILLTLQTFVIIKHYWYPGSWEALSCTTCEIPSLLEAGSIDKQDACSSGCRSIRHE
jgi:hypothetical protein